MKKNILISLLILVVVAISWNWYSHKQKLIAEEKANHSLREKIDSLSGLIHGGTSSPARVEAPWITTTTVIALDNANPPNVVVGATIGIYDVNTAAYKTSGVTNIDGKYAPQGLTLAQQYQATAVSSNGKIKGTVKFYAATGGIARDTLK